MFELIVIDITVSFIFAGTLVRLFKGSLPGDLSPGFLGARQ